MKALYKSELKTIKVRLCNLLKNPQFHQIINEKVTSVNKIQFISYHFIRSFILYLYDKQIDIPNIDITIIAHVFNLFIKNNNKGRKSIQNDYTKLVDKYYDDIFSKIYKHKIIDTNISFILNEAAKKMSTCYKNNIVLNFYKYLNQYINGIFSSKCPDKKNYKTNEEFKLAKKLFLYNLRLLKDSLMQNNLDGCPKIYKKWYKLNKDTMLPKINETNYGTDIKHYPFKYLKYMLNMNKKLEKKKLKMFQCICLRTDLKDKYITINSSALIQLFDFGQPINKLAANLSEQKAKLWNKIIDVSKIKLKNYSFNHQISTDGTSVSISFINNDKIEKKIKVNKMKKDARNETFKIYKKLGAKEKEKLKEKKNKAKIQKSIEAKKKWKEQIKKRNEAFKKLSKTEQNELKLKLRLKLNEFSYIEDLIKNPKFYEFLKAEYENGDLVYGDPGKRDIVKFIDNNGKGFRYSNRRRIKETGRIKINRLIHNKKKKIKLNKKTIEQYEQELIKFNTKTTNHEKFNKYIQKKVKLRDLIITNKTYNEYLKKLKWHSHINKQKHESKLINDIKNVYGENATFIIGDWNGNTKLKYISTPGLGFKRLMAKHFNVYIIDEYNTSQFNCYTDKKNTKLELTTKHNKVLELYSVFTYYMSNGLLGIINRDRNAALNMKKIVGHLIKTKKRPYLYDRKKYIQDPLTVKQSSNGTRKVLHLTKDLKTGRTYREKIKLTKKRKNNNIKKLKSKKNNKKLTNK